MKKEKFLIVLIPLFLMVAQKHVFAENYHIAGYVLLENSNLPVHDQIVEIKDNSGSNLGSFLTNFHGLYAGDFEIDTTGNNVIKVELSRNCNGSVVIYSVDVFPDNPYLTCNFTVCSEQPCHASFRYQQMDLNSLVFEFTDVSRGNITNWLWDFGDQTFSTEQNPTHEFPHPDHYQVKLTIAGPGCMDSRQRTVFAFYESCLARYDYQQVNLGGEMIVQFQDESLGNMNDWFWEFGDGQFSSIQNPSHQYDQPGEYDVKLSIHGPGCSNMTHQPVVVEPVAECFALFNTFQQPDAGFKVLFTDLSIGETDTWQWDFGDGNTGSGKEIIHYYGNPGDYQVILSIAGPNCTDTYSRILHLLQTTDCQPVFDYYQDTILEPIITFVNLTPDKSLIYSWDFGDGTTSQETSPVHEYLQAGYYNVELKTTGFGCSDSLLQQIEVLAPIPCDAGFSFSSTSPAALEISFTNESVGMIIGNHWDFGDNTFSNEENPVHLFPAPGDYIVKLRIDAIGCIDSIEKNLHIDEPPYCDAAFSMEQEYPQSRLISFINESVGNNFISSWDFGDGNYSNVLNPIHEYPSHGQYPVSLIISTSDNCADTIIQTVDILPPLVLQGNVYAGSNQLPWGSVYLYKTDGTDNVSIFDQVVLDGESGHFIFSGLTPGTYFAQAVPLLEFPFPVIPTYFPTYSGEKSGWVEAMTFQTRNLPENYDLYLLYYNDFFDGNASISGKLLLNQTGQDIPVIIYLTDESDNMRSFRIPDDQHEFGFLNIPFGNYKIYPEKPGKTGQPFIVELSEEKPESHGIVFTETETSIVPDLTTINDLVGIDIKLVPNPADQMVNIYVNGSLWDHPGYKVFVYTSGLRLIDIIQATGNTCLINVTDYPDGLYFVEIEYNLSKIIHKKLIIIH